jgi:hypothetical protein
MRAGDRRSVFASLFGRLDGMPSTQFCQQFRIDVNDRPSLTDFEPKPIKPFSVCRGIPGFLTAVADIAANRSRVFFLAPSSFCSPSQFKSQLRCDYDSRQISGIRAELARARWPVSFFQFYSSLLDFRSFFQISPIMMRSFLRW